LRVLIAGCGYVGSALAQRLAADGAQVFGLARRPVGLPPGVEPLAADLGDPATLEALPEGLELVFYAASSDARDPAAYERAYVLGVSNLLARLASYQTPRRFFLVSSTSVYGQHQGEWVDEESPTTPARFTGRALLEGERLVLEAPFPTTVVRFGGIYGPGRTSLVDRVRAGQARWRPDHYTNRIHRDDCAGALRHLAGLDAPAQLYLGVDDEPALERDVLFWLADRLGSESLPVAGPREGTRAGPGSKRCSNARLRAVGYRFRYPSFRQGYGDLLTSRGR
jgi:nucleoside-diphosphate-sugar epimerase